MLDLIIPIVDAPAFLGAAEPGRRLTAAPATCPQCDGPRVPPRQPMFGTVDAWRNPCGHSDSHTLMVHGAQAAA